MVIAYYLGIVESKLLKEFCLYYIKFKICKIKKIKSDHSWQTADIRSSIEKQKTKLINLPKMSGTNFLRKYEKKCGWLILLDSN